VKFRDENKGTPDGVKKDKDVVKGGAIRKAKSFLSRVAIKTGPSRGLEPTEVLKPSDFAAKVALILSAIRMSLTKEDIIKHQATDDNCKMMLDYLKDETLPEDDNKARRVLLTAGNHLLYDGLLFQVHVVSKPKLPEATLRLLVPQKLVLSLLEVLHSAPYHSNLGANRMLLMVSQSFVWINMSRDVVKYVSSCPKCALCKKSQHCENPPFSEQDLVQESGKVLFMDILGPM